jgi:hypothetical protein
MGAGELMIKVRYILLHGIAAAVGAILFGLPYFRLNVFHYHNQAFQLVILGFFIGILIAASEASALPQYVVVTALVWLVHVLVVRSSTWPAFLRDAVYLAGLSAAAYGSQRILARAGGRVKRMGRSLLRVAALLVGYFAARVGLCLLWGVEDWAREVGFMGQLGLVLAVGSVVGVEVGKAIAGQRRMGVA